MFIVFLPSLKFRGNRAPYLWWFHKLLDSYGEQAAYVCGEEYFLDPAELLVLQRVEVAGEMEKLYQYSVPNQATLEKQFRVDIPVEVWAALEMRFPSNPLAAFKYYCLEEDPRLCNAIDLAFDEVISQAGVPEAVITCVNCASLRKVCVSRNIRLLHVEVGPLRQPFFLQTAYLDFSGVNGGTEAETRFLEASDEFGSEDNWADVKNLRALMMLRSMDPIGPPEVDLGLVLQVEDDSNLLCFSNGFSALSLINQARGDLEEGRITPPVVVRSHPGSFFTLRYLPSGLKPDRSASSPHFIIRCKCINTINSGAAVEALLLERAVCVHGDSPFAFVVDRGNGKCGAVALAFFLLNYLVPWTLAFQPDYVRWRLLNPPESDIRQRHVENFVRDRVRALEERVADLERTLADRERQLAQIRESLLWRAAFPVWKVVRYVLRRIGWYNPY